MFVSFSVQRLLEAVRGMTGLSGSAVELQLLVEKHFRYFFPSPMDDLSRWTSAHLQMAKIK